MPKFSSGRVVRKSGGPRMCLQSPIGQHGICMHLLYLFVEHRTFRIKYKKQCLCFVREVDFSLWWFILFTFGSYYALCTLTVTKKSHFPTLPCIQCLPFCCTFTENRIFDAHLSHGWKENNFYLMIAYINNKTYWLM